MITSKITLSLLKKLIDKRYAAFTISMLGRQVFSKEQLKQLEEEGVDTSEKGSLIEMAYYHNILNPHGKDGAPTSVEDMKSQQEGTKLPAEPHHKYTVEHLNESMKSSLEKLRQDYTTRIEGFVRDNNHNFKFSSLQGAGRVEEVENLVKDSAVHKLKQILRDSSGDANRDWLRVATTEMSNAIGIGSVDRIAEHNKGKDFNDVYVYRIVVNDAALCKYCRRFYQDSDGSPKVYKLSTLLGNGSNYGKKAAEWLPVVGATHPNERCSQMIELKRGWQVLPGGRQQYIGAEKWADYILNKAS